MENVVKAICQALIEEAGLIISHTDKIAALGSNEVRTAVQKLEEMRLDEVVHVQNLTLELTRLFMSGEGQGKEELPQEPAGGEALE